MKPNLGVVDISRTDLVMYLELRILNKRDDLGMCLIIVDGTLAQVTALQEVGCTYASQGMDSNYQLIMRCSIAIWQIVWLQR